MSNFICEHCGEIIGDTPSGYVTGCEHYPQDIAYDAEHDAWYRIKDGKWLDKQCKDPECEFCKDRPARRMDA